MKTIKQWWPSILTAIIAIPLFTMWIAHSLPQAHAQDPAQSPMEITAGGAHTLCHLATGQYCLATDGLWFSANGTSWAQIGASAAPVLPASITAAVGLCLTGYSASTGQWTTSPCVNTVNGKSGTAAITATTTLQ
jgi:hypothetical protein